MTLKPFVRWASGLALVGLALFGAIRLTASAEPERIAARSPMPPSAPPPFVRSMQGTQPDGKLEVIGADDALQVDAELVHLFDYYLSAIGEKPLGVIVTELERELDRKLKPRAAREAKRLLAAYIDFKRELVGLEANLKPGKSQGESARGRLQAMQQARARRFTATEVGALFGEADLRDQDALARIEVGENTALSAEQKRAQIDQLDRQLPASLREERDAPLRVARVEEQVALLRAKGGTDQDVYQFRAQAFSPEAASRLAEVDRDEIEWQARIAAYLAARRQILQASLNASQQSTAIDELRSRQFGIDEQRRLPAYE